MKENSLLYDSCLNRYKSLYYGNTDCPNVGDDVIDEACIDHANLVFDAIREEFLKSIGIASHLGSTNAAYFMLYGAGRRLEMIFFAYRTLIFTIPPKRKTPLNTDESRKITRSLNVIYMNIRGVLDNFAWSILHEKDPDQAGTLTKSPSSVSIFSKYIYNICSKELNCILHRYEDWNKDIKRRRDPSAHRIPLHVPPQLLTTAEAETYRHLYDQSMQSVLELDFDQADRHFDDLNSLGRFIPIFVHHPDDGPIRLYPTVSIDLSHLAIIGQSVRAFLQT